MTDEDRFVAVLLELESSGDHHAWGDDGMACGGWQQHPGFYAMWGPKLADFAMEERTWAWAFEFAVRKFFRSFRHHWPGVELIRIALAYHLLGFVTLNADDPGYRARWDRAVAIIRTRPGATFDGDS